MNLLVYDFSVDYKAIDTNDIADIYECLIKKHDIT